MIIKQDYGTVSETARVKIIEPNVVVGANTIETGVPIKQIMYVWQKADGSNDQYINGQWSDIRPNETWISFSTSSTANAKRAIPNTANTCIQSISGSSFVFAINQNDYNRFNGSPLRFYIYY